MTNNNDDDVDDLDDDEDDDDNDDDDDDDQYPVGWRVKCATTQLFRSPTLFPTWLLDQPYDDDGDTHPHICQVGGFCS